MKRKLSFWRFITPVIIGFLFLAGGYLLLSSLSGLIVESKEDWQGPDRGLWYCEELQLQLCFQNETPPIFEDGWVNTHSYAIIENTPIMCIPENEGTYGINVINQDASAGNDLGKKFFEGKFISLDENVYIVSDKNGEDVAFTRVKEFSLEEKIDSYRKFIDQYNGAKTVGDVQHIAIVVQKAKELWRTELQTGTTADEVTVAFDFESKCWLISQGPLIALINTNGNVIGVFRSTG